MRYLRLSRPVRTLADKSFELLERKPRHPSLHLKRIGPLSSVRVGQSHRALRMEVPEGVLWFWIGSHADYDRIMG